MTWHPVRSAAFFGPVAGNPCMMAMRRQVPVGWYLHILTAAPVPFRCDPDMIGGRGLAALDDPFGGMYFNVIVLSLNLEAAKQ